jgi:hypothetical protein
LCDAPTKRGKLDDGGELYEKLYVWLPRQARLGAPPTTHAAVWGGTAVDENQSQTELHVYTHT